MDVIVIGGGIMGASITYHLAKEGIKVLLIEKGSIANTGGASRASAGGLRENDRDPRELSLAQSSLQRWESLEEELDADMEYSPYGQLKLFDEDISVSQFQEKMKDNKEQGIESYALGQEEINDISSYISSEFPHGIFYPKGGHANPLLATLAFMNAARRLGAEVKTGTKVFSIKMQNGKVKGVHTESNFIASNLVINAAGIWAPILHDTLHTDLPLPIRPRIPQMSATLPGPPLLEPVISIEGRKLSLKQTRDGRIRAGGGYDSKPGPNKYAAVFSEESLSKQRKEVISVLPEAARYPIDFTYYGVEAQSLDNIPIIGPVPGLEGYLLATGFSGHGFTLSPGIGQVVAELAQGKQSSISIEDLTMERIVDKSIYYEKQGRDYPG